MADMQFDEAPATFARLATGATSLRAGLEDRGWTVADVRFGWMTASPNFLVFGPPAPMVEIDTSVKRERFLLIGNAPSVGSPLLWTLYGRENVQEHEESTVIFFGDDNTALHQLDAAFMGRNDRKSGIGYIIGDPAALSFFAITAAFVGGMLAEGGKDLYLKLKSMTSRARAFRRIEGSSTNPWVVVHDPEKNCVLEFPREFPPAAAEQLIRLPAQQLSQSHLRWNPATEKWERVQGSLFRAGPDGSSPA